MAEVKRTFSIKGMHCASCVRTLERALGKVSGVTEANVNLATEKATVTYDDAICTPEQMESAVTGVGYKAMVRGEQQDEDIEKAEKQKELNSLKNKVLISLSLGFLIVWGSFPGLMEFAPNVLRNFWVQLILAIPVQFCAGLTFYQATIPALRHRTANMDTLVAIGTTVAFTYSAVVTIFPQLLTPYTLNPIPYFDVSTIIIGLILLC